MPASSSSSRATRAMQIGGRSRGPAQYPALRQARAGEAEAPRLYQRAPDLRCRPAALPAGRPGRCRSEEEAEVLRNIPLFAKREPAKLKLLAFTSERLTFDAGQQLFQQGDPGD